ncbi:ABC transporter permease [Actinopolyspora mortivallis]|uniref:ABC transporter n=1 Tax=Actinopolyspora mortivallis TaxID=33906 RepID=A0A2T0GSL4_ACTMO|nr:ABC transporter permease [Actinopolyspora mortivallis]PRW62033.1 ABC transporter [Actinopolyspora mortivallis]
MRIPFDVFRVGVRRGLTELRHTFTNAQDLFGQACWAGVLLGVLLWTRDDPLPGTPVSISAFLLPGLVAMSVGFNGMVSLAQSLTVEREDGTLLRARTLPNGMLAYLLGKVVTVSGTVLASTAVLLVPGAFVLDVLALHQVDTWLMLVWVLPLGLVATLPVGAVIGSLTDNPRSIGLVMLPILGIVSISGVFFPTSALPEWLRQLGQMFPVYWLSHGTRSALLPEGSVPEGAWLETFGMLGLWALGGLVVAPFVLRFMARRESGSNVAARQRRAMRRIG